MKTTKKSSNNKKPIFQLPQEDMDEINEQIDNMNEFEQKAKYGVEQFLKIVFSQPKIDISDFSIILDNFKLRIENNTLLLNKIHNGLATKEDAKNFIGNKYQNLTEVNILERSLKLIVEISEEKYLISGYIIEEMKKLNKKIQDKNQSTMDYLISKKQKIKN